MCNSTSNYKRHFKTLSLVSMLVVFSGCQSMYYGAMEKVGYEKRDILVDRVDDARDAQQEAKEQFESALEQFVVVMNYSGGELESQYKKLKSEYDESKERAENLTDRIESVEHVAGALFEEWEKEILLYSNRDLQRASEKQMKDTKTSYTRLIKSMRLAEHKVEPVLRAFNDRVLFLKHNLNANAISSLRSQKKAVETDIKSLIVDMNKSIEEADRFIKTMSH